MRIIGGNLRGKRISSPPGRNTRPTTDRVRENLFNILANRMDFGGKQVLDLFAGSGALGLEALSRGAEFCLFVENSHSACSVITENLQLSGLKEKTGLMRTDATRLPDAQGKRRFDLVFADPPYSMGLGEKSAASLIRGKWLADNAMFILEEDSKAMPDLLNEFNILDVRTYGGTAIGIFEFSPLKSI